MFRFIFAVLLLTCGVMTLAAQETPLRPDLPYRAERSAPVVHEIDFSIVVTPPYQCQTLKVWVPVPQTDFGQEIGPSRFSTFPMKVEPQLATEDKFGNRFAYFEFHRPQGAQIIRHRFGARVWNLHWKLEADRVKSVKAWPSPFTPYLAPPAIADRREFEKILQEIVPERKNTGETFVRVLDWIDSNLSYDHGDASLRADPNHAFSQRRGHCSDYHGLCAAMGQHLGYPARVTYGLSLYAKNSPSHCRLEAFLPPYGWVSFDLSETQQMIKRIHEDKELDAATKASLAQAARARLRSGFRENCWLLLTKGTNYELAPKASQPVPLVRTAYIEADGEALPDPDPANSAQREFAWMTVHDYQADRPFPLPFKDLDTLKPYLQEP